MSEFENIMWGGGFDPGEFSNLPSEITAEELESLMERAIIWSRAVPNEFWTRAYENLAMAANTLHAMTVRFDVYWDEINDALDDEDDDDDDG